MTIQHLYPTTRPSLDLNFARTKRLDPRVTFTRGSTATYVGSDGLIKTAAANEARFDHDPATGESLGLLVEEARTNLVTYSEQFDNAAWTKSSTTVTANDTAAPDGNTTADKVIVNNGATSADIRRTGLSTNGVMSFYAKAGGFNYIGGEAHTAAGGYPKFRVDLLTGVSSTSDSSISISTQNVGNNWWRIFVVGNFGNNAFIISPRNDYAFFGSAISGADGVKGAYLWGAQLEAGTFPTSYIPTTSSTVTRSADVASMTGTNFSSWYNQSEGTVIVDLPKNLNSVDNNDVMFSFHNGSTNRVFPQWVSYSWFWKAASAQVAINPYVSSTSTVGKYAFSFDSSNISATYNGQTTNTTSSGSLNQDVTGLRFFTEWNGGRAITGYLSRLTYYPTRLPDAQLQALTL